LKVSEQAEFWLRLDPDYPSGRGLTAPSVDEIAAERFAALEAAAHGLCTALPFGGQVLDRYYIVQ
jgi:hypothetical protein